jgi:hypothetical protein
MQMIIMNNKTFLAKNVDLDKWSIGDITIIYDFYSNHKDYSIIIDNELDV